MVTWLPYLVQVLVHFVVARIRRGQSFALIKTDFPLGTCFSSFELLGLLHTTYRSKKNNERYNFSNKQKCYIGMHVLTPLP